MTQNRGAISGQFRNPSPGKREFRLRATAKPPRAALAVACGVFCTVTLWTIGAFADSGDLDPSFGIGGVATVSFGGGTANIVDAATTPDGKIVVTGTTSSTNPLSFSVARFTSGGALDGGFGNGGKVTTAFSGGGAQSYAVAVQSDGKVVVAGFCSSNNLDFALARYNANGSLDNSFGNKGKVTTDIGRRTVDSAREVLIQWDGKIVAIGVSNDTLAAVRYTTSGSLDTTFSGDGKLVTTVPVVGNVQRARLQADGKIITVATSATGFESSVVVRIGTGGTVETVAPLYLGLGGGYATDVCEQADGKIVVSGTVDAYESSYVARLHPGLALDTTFNGTGFYKDTTLLFGRGVAVQGDGKIVVTGYEYDQGTGTSRLTALRVATDGSPDATFGPAGHAVVAFGSTTGKSVLVPGNGTILLAGAEFNGQIVLARIFE